jgi:hypothetical protein
MSLRVLLVISRAGFTSKNNVEYGIRFNDYIKDTKPDFYNMPNLKAFQEFVGFLEPEKRPLSYIRHI